MVRDGPNVGRDRSGSVSPKRKPLGRLVAAFKTVSTSRVNDLRSTSGVRLWQRNYYERVIRNDMSLQAASSLHHQQSIVVRQTSDQS